MPIEKLIPPRGRDLGGGFMVRRLLPSVAPQQGVGPFVFFDHFGPITSRPGDNHDVRPHPHIGLATVTYLFEGAMMHRDSLGSVQRIEPGAINWMTAGRGIVHSERTPADLKQKEYVAHGLQLWAALPEAHEETAPAFSHTPATAIPEWSAPGVRVRVLVGDAFGLRSPVTTYSETLYLDVFAETGATLVLPASMKRVPSLPSTAWMSRCRSTVTRFPRLRWPCWFQAPVRRSRRRAGRASSWSGANRSMRRARSGGISSLRARIESSRPRPIGPRSGWARSPVNTNGFHCHDRAVWVRVRTCA